MIKETQELTECQYNQLVTLIYEREKRVDVYYCSTLSELTFSMLSGFFAIIMHAFFSHVHFYEPIFYSFLLVSIYFFFLGLSYLLLFMFEEKVYKEIVYDVLDVEDDKDENETEELKTEYMNF